MKPGRELDVLIGEKVMGADAASVLKPYSTDIAVAWEVVEKLDILVSLYGPQTGPMSDNLEWRCTFIKGPLSPGTVVGETPAHAICLAALALT